MLDLKDLNIEKRAYVSVMGDASGCRLRYQIGFVLHYPYTYTRYRENGAPYEVESVSEFYTKEKDEIIDLICKLTGCDPQQANYMIPELANYVIKTLPQRPDLFQGDQDYQDSEPVRPPHIGLSRSDLSKMRDYLIARDKSDDFTPEQREQSVNALTRDPLRREVLSILKTHVDRIMFEVSPFSLAGAFGQVSEDISQIEDRVILQAMLQTSLDRVAHLQEIAASNHDTAMRMLENLRTATRELLRVKYTLTELQADGHQTELLSQSHEIGYQSLTDLLAGGNEIAYRNQHGSYITMRHDAGREKYLCETSFLDDRYPERSFVDLDAAVSFYNTIVRLIDRRAAKIAEEAKGVQST